MGALFSMQKKSPDILHRNYCALSLWHQITNHARRGKTHKMGYQNAPPFDYIGEAVAVTALFMAGCWLASYLINTIFDNGKEKRENRR